MDTAVTPEHVFVLALSAKGDVTTAPLEGVVTVMACAGIEKAASANAAKSKVFMSPTSSDMAVHVFSQPGLLDTFPEQTAGGIHFRVFLTKSPTVMSHCLSNISAFVVKDYKLKSCEEEARFASRGVRE